MKKAATLAVLALAASQVEGVCDANWVTTAANLATTGQAAADSSAATTCATLKASSCCLPATLNSIVTKAGDLVTTLKTTVGNRDKFLLNRRGDVLAIADSLNQIQEAVAKISTSTSTGSVDLTGLTAFITANKAAITAFTENFSTLKANFITMQKSRATCIDALVQAQATIWCAACAPDITAATIGFTASGNSGTIAFGDTFKGFLSSKCYSYVADSKTQSQILTLYYLSSYLESLAAAFTAFVDGDYAAALTAYTEYTTDLAKATTPTGVEQAAGDVGTCTTSDCAWLTSSVLSTGILDQTLTVVGGTIVSSRRLEAEIPSGRMLAGLDVDPSAEAVGVTPAFPENPGSVDNDQNSAVRNGVVACAITALVALF